MPAGGEKSQVGSAEAEAVAQRLSFTNDDIRTGITRSHQEAEGNRIAADNQQRVPAVRQIRSLPQILDNAEEIRILDDHRRRIIG